MSLSSTSGLPKNSSRAQTTSSTQRNKFKLERTQRKSLNANELISVESGTKQTSLGFISQNPRCRRQKSQEGLKVSDISSENGPVACKNQKTQKGLKVPAICSENGPVERKRQKSQEGLKVSDICSENGPVACKNQKSQKGLKEPNICSENGPVERKRQKSQKRLKVPGICSENGPVACKIQKSQDHKTSQGQSHEEPLRKGLRRYKSKSIVVSSSARGFNVPKDTQNSEKLREKQNMVNENKSPKNDESEEESEDVPTDLNALEDFLLSTYTSSDDSSTSYDNEKEQDDILEGIVQHRHKTSLDLAASSNLVSVNMNQNNITIESKSPKNNESEQESESESDVPTDLNVLEDHWLSTYTSSDDSSTSYNNEKEQDDILEGIVQHRHNPTLDLAASSNLVPVNMNQNNITIESKSPKNNESEQESEDVPTDLNALEDHLLSTFTSSDDSSTSYDNEKEQGDILQGIVQPIHNRVESLQTTPISGTKNENNTLSTIGDIAVEPNLVNVSPIRACSIVVKRLHPAVISKYSTTNKQLEKDGTSCKNVCVDPVVSNQLALVHQPSRPKLNKASILKRKIISKSPSFKQKKTDSDNVDWLRLDRTVSVRSDERIVITKKFTEPKVEKEPETLTLHKNNDSAVKRKCTEPKVEREPVKLKLHENNHSTAKRKCPESNHGQTTNKTYMTFNNNPNQSQEQFKNTHCNGEVTQLTRFEGKNLQNSIDEKQLNTLKVEPPKVGKELVKLKLHKNNDGVVKGKYPETNHGQTTNKAHITFNNNPNQLKKKCKNTHFNGEVTQLTRFEDKNLRKSIDEKQLKNLKVEPPKVGKEPVKLTLYKNNDSAVKRKCTEPKVEREPVKLKLHENNQSTVKRKCPESNHGQPTNKTRITFNNNSNQSQEQFKNTHCNGEVTQLTRFEDKNLQKSIDEKQLKNLKVEPPKVGKELVKLKLHKNNDGVVKRKYPETNHGQTTNKTHITFNNNPNQLQEQCKNTHLNGEVTQLKRFEDKHLQKSIDEKQLKNGTVPSELKLRNRITLKEKNSPDKVVTHNNPLSSQCNFNARSNLEVDSTQLQIQEKIPPKDFNFLLPKPIRHQVVLPIQEDDDDDDASSVISIYASSDIVNYVNNEQFPEQNKTTGTKFDRLNKYGHDDEEKEDDKKCNNYTVNINEAGPSGIRGTNAEMSKRNNLYTSSLMTPEREACLDLFADKDPLESSPFEGYCMLYFRTSIDEHPGCLLMHEVPNHVFSVVNSPQVVQITDCAIGEIIEENFINPPVDLVLLFVSFCVRFSKKQTLVRLGQCLKNNYDGETQKAHEIWYNFFKGIIDSKYDPVPNIPKCKFISIILHHVFGEIVDTEVFTVVLKSLLTLRNYFTFRVQLLTCINFLFERGQKNNSLKLIPIEFATAIINQCLETFSHNNKIPFVYKVLKTFFNDLDYARRLYCYDKSTFSSFVDTVESNNIGTLSFQIKQLQMSGLETSSLENLERTKTHSDSPLQQREQSRRAIKCACDARSLCAALERNFETRALNPNEIYTLFNSTLKYELLYSALSLLRYPVKKSLSDVIMSFISYEADKKRWDVCFKLYKSLCFNPQIIKNFYGNNSPVSNILTVVSVYLNNNNIMEALNIFNLHNLSKDPSYWELDFFPCDLERRMLICATFTDHLRSIDTQDLYNVLMQLIPLQKSLEEPIDLTFHVRTVLCGLIENQLDSKAAKLIALIFDEEKSYSFVLARDHLYRALVVILCNEKEHTYASMLYAKAQSRVPLYPQLPTSITDIGTEMSVEIYSFLTKQEMLVVFFTLLKLYGDEIKNIGFSANFKVYRKQPTDATMSYIFNPYLSVDDDSIPAAIQRFKEAVRELIPNAIFKESWLNEIEVEKISIQEYMYKLNQTGSSGED